jgi:hypothetical protein
MAGRKMKTIYKPPPKELFDKQYDSMEESKEAAKQITETYNMEVFVFQSMGIPEKPYVWR